MRMRSLILASLLPLALGCPGDDTSDTDAHETEHAQTSSTTDDTTPGTTTDDTTTPTSTSTTTMDGTSTGPMDGSSTSGSMDGSSSGSMETTGGVNEACVMFCTDYFATCGEDPGNDYGDQAGCETACSGFDQAGFDCRRMHLMLAEGDPATHCPHASASGAGGPCS